MKRHTDSVNQEDLVTGKGATRRPKSKTVLTERGGWSHPHSALGDEDHQETNELHRAVRLITQELRRGSWSESRDV